MEIQIIHDGVEHKMENSCTYLSETFEITVTSIDILFHNNLDGYFYSSIFDVLVGYLASVNMKRGLK